MGFAIIILCVHENSQMDVLEIGGAVGGSCLFPNSIQGGDEYAHEYRNNGNHNQQFE